MLPVFSPTPSFVLVNIPQMRFPKSGGERSTHARVHRANIVRQTHLSHQHAGWLASLSFPVLIKIPY